MPLSLASKGADVLAEKSNPSKDKETSIFTMSTEAPPLHRDRARLSSDLISGSVADLEILYYLMRRSLILLPGCILTGLNGVACLEPEALHGLPLVGV